MDILILSNKNDWFADNLDLQLKKRGINSVIVYAEQLVLAKSWSQTISSEGNCTTEIVLQNGTIINNNDVNCVYNRIRFLEMFHFINATDRNYADLEMLALYVSFLKSMDSKMLEPIQNKDLIIEETNLLYYYTVAAQCGIDVLNYHFTTAPKWQNISSNTALNPTRKNQHTFYKKSNYLVWQNQPLISFQPYQKLLNIIVIGGQFQEPLLNSLSEPICKFSKKINKVFFEMQMVLSNGEFKLMGVNDFPITTSNEALIKFADHIIKYKLQVA